MNVRSIADRQADSRAHSRAHSLAEALTGLVEGDEAEAEAAAAGILALPAALQPEALKALQELLASAEVERRWWAIRWLAALTGSEITPCLLQGLHDEDASVRQCAALGLRGRPEPEAVEGLIQALDDDDTLVRRLVGEALGAAGGAAVPGLLGVLESGAQPARLEAARALAVIGDTRAIPALFEALDGSALMEYWASEGLERMGVGMSFFLPTSG
jgi:HEAT repeat protein